MFIARFCANTLGMSERKSAMVQLGTCVLLVVLTFVFTDFFVSLAIMLMLFAPLWLLYMYIIYGIYSSYHFLNLTR